MKFHALRFLSARWPRHARKVTVSVSPIAGGLESAVARVDVHSTHGAHTPIPRRFIVKELRGVQRREERVYEALWCGGNRPPAARVIGRTTEGDTSYLYLEEVSAESSWPWRETAASAAVCRALAKFHRTAASPSRPIVNWDYEQELTGSALDTLEFATTARDASGNRHWARLGDLHRVVSALPRIRADLMASGVVFIHGDVHPGNVIVTRRGPTRRIVLIDWGRARLGSPLEDIASWLHSLGCWEPEARRRHDTLLRDYLLARGFGGKLEAEFRRRYWFASATNGLAGAIRHHLSILDDAHSTDDMRGNSRQALEAWQRVMRRAAALLASAPLTKP